MVDTVPKSCTMLALSTNDKLATNKLGGGGEEEGGASLMSEM